MWFGDSEFLDGIHYWVMPGVATTIAASDYVDGIGDDEYGVGWGIIKTLLIWPGIIFGAIMGGINGSYNHDAAKVQQKFIEQSNQIVDVIKTKAIYSGFEGTDVEPGTFSVDTKNGKITGTLIYKGIDKDGDNAKYIGRFEADVDKEKLQAYTVNLEQYSKTIDFIDSSIVNVNQEKRKIGYWSTAWSQDKVYNTYKTAAENLTSSFEDVVNSSSNFKVESVGKAYDFNQSLLKNALYTNPTLVSNTKGYVAGLFTVGSVKTELLTNGTMLLGVSEVSKAANDNTAKFYVNYLETQGEETEFKQSKIVVDTTKYDATKCSLNEFAYNEFIEGSNKLFSQNDVSVMDNTDKNTMIL